MKIFRGSTFTADRAWGVVEIADMSGITTRLHGTEQAAAVSQRGLMRVRSINSDAPRWTGPRWVLS